MPTTTDKPGAVAPPPEHLSVPSRNPLPLSASQESQVRDIYYARVRKNCTEEIKGTRRPSLPPLRDSSNKTDVARKANLPLGEP